MESKAYLLEILSGTTCPICQGTKARFIWTCPPCYRPHQQTREHRTLSDTCDAHMYAAQAFLAIAGKPRESE